MVEKSKDKPEDKPEDKDMAVNPDEEPVQQKKGRGIGKLNWALLIIVMALMAFSQYKIISVSSGGVLFGQPRLSFSDADITSIKSTGHSIAALFPVNDIKTVQDAVNIMIPTGKPEYGDAMGVSFDEPIKSMELLARTYNSVKANIKQNYPEVWQRYLNLATKPVGISCEFCCGVGPSGIRNNGELACGCQHNPALQTLTLWFMNNTDYSDAEVLREVMRWKSLWFPKDMVSLTMKVAGGDASSLNELPGMVGGC